MKPTLLLRDSGRGQHASAQPGWLPGCRPSAGHRCRPPLSAGDLPDVGATEIFMGLNLKADTNYGVLLLHGDQADDLSSSFATANQGFAVQMQSFAAPKRGVIFGIEDLRKDQQNYDADFNDLIVTFAGSDFNID